MQIKFACVGDGKPDRKCRFLTEADQGRPILLVSVLPAPSDIPHTKTIQ